MTTLTPISFWYQVNGVLKQNTQSCKTVKPCLQWLFRHLLGWVILRINMALTFIFQLYHDSEAGYTKSVKIEANRPGVKPQNTFSVSQELNHFTTAAPIKLWTKLVSVFDNMDTKNYTQKVWISRQLKSQNIIGISRYTFCIILYLCYILENML